VPLAPAVFVAVELTPGQPSLAPAWLTMAVLVEVGAVSCYGRMQRHLLRSARVRVPTRRHVALA